MNLQGDRYPRCTAWLDVRVVGAQLDQRGPIVIEKLDHQGDFCREYVVIACGKVVLKCDRIVGYRRGPGIRWRRLDIHRPRNDGEDNEDRDDDD